VFERARPHTRQRNLLLNSTQQTWQETTFLLLSQLASGLAFYIKQFLSTASRVMTDTAPVVQPPTLDPHSPSDAAQALQSLQDRPAEAQTVEAIKPSSKTLVELEGVTYKRCTHCKELKVRDQNFNKDKSRGDGYACTCKGCANRHTRAWHERHKQQVCACYSQANSSHMGSLYTLGIAKVLYCASLLVF